MLSQLSIQNFGLIDRVDIEFTAKLNILTGSTGAGKSILIDALRLALGERLKSAQIRDAAKPCQVEAVFDLSQSPLCRDVRFQDYLDEDAVLIILRQCLPDGKNKIKINGQSVTVGQLKDIGNHLVDFHGAHDHQLLLSPDSHLGMLDQLVEWGSTKDKYRTCYREYATLKEQYGQLKAMAASRERDLDLLVHQVKELEQVPLSDESYDQLCQEQVKIQNAEQLYQSAAALLQLLDGSDTSLSEVIRQSFGPMKALNQIDEKTAALHETLSLLQENSDELVSTLKDYAESLAFEPQEAEDVNRRYDIYEDVRRKYGPALSQVREFYQEAKHKYDLLVNLEHNDADIRQKLDEQEKELRQAARKLTAARTKTAALLKKTIEKELKELGIPQVAFEARIETVDFHKEGCDQVIFYISPNAGEDLKPLSEIVSSGEAARLMLALKKALTKVDPIPVLIFDEIDAQIGGRLGTVTGNKLKSLSNNRQVILITHLPQIASFADAHFKVTKAVTSGRTVTRVAELDAGQRVDELAQMMGEHQTDIAVSHAQDLLENAQK